MVYYSMYTKLRIISYYRLNYRIAVQKMLARFEETGTIGQREGSSKTTKIKHQLLMQLLY